MKTIFQILLTLAVIPSAAEAASILTNGSFETGDPPTFWDYSGIGALGVNRFASQSTAAGTFNNGVASLSLGSLPDDFNAGNGGPGTGPATSTAIQTTTAGSVIPGSVYTFSFAMKQATGSYTIGVQYRYQLEFLDATNAVVFNTGLINVAGINATTFTNVSNMYLAPLGSSSARVSFNLDAGANNNSGGTQAQMLVDNAVLDAVPEPSVSAALVLGMVVFAGRRNRVKR